MKPDIDEGDEGRVHASLIAGGVMAAMLLVMAVFLSQFPEIDSPGSRITAAKVARR